MTMSPILIVFCDLTTTTVTAMDIIHTFLCCSVRIFCSQEFFVEVRHQKTIVTQKWKGKCYFLALIASEKAVPCRFD
jgi:hypothetical protein